MPISPARAFFESALRDKITFNTSHRMAPSETALAERMLARGLELEGLYEEVYSATEVDEQRHIFLACCVLDIGLCWTEADGRQARDDKKRLEELNADIAELADELAGLLEQRTAVNERGAFSTDHAFHILDVMDEAARGNGLYPLYLREPLDHLRGRFELKYWPKLAEVVRAIGQDSTRAGVEPLDPLTAAMCQSTRSSKADVVRAIQASIEHNKRGGMHCLPDSFKLTDGALASLTNVLLDLHADKLVDAEYVKNIGNRPLKRRKD